MKSLRLKILIPILIVIVLSISTLSFIAYYQANRILNNDVETITKVQVEKIVIFVEEQLHEWKGKIELLATVENVKNMDFMNLKKYVSEKENIFEEFNAIIISDTDGNMKSTVGKFGDISQKEYFRKVMTGETVVSKPITSTDTEEPVIIIATPIKDNSGKVIGLIGGSINLSLISDFVNAEKLGENGYAFMINSEGLLMAHPTKEYILNRNLLKEENQNIVAIAKKMVKGEDGIEHYDFNGKQRIATFKSFKSTGWSVAMTVNYSELTHEIDMFRNILLTIGIVTLVLITIVVYLLISRSIKPLHKMIAITKQVAEGNLTIKVDTKSNDEIGSLANNFNKMIESMSNLIGEMNHMGMTVSSASQEMLTLSREANKVAEQVTATISELAQGASEQAKSTQEGYDTINGLIDGIAIITNNAGHSQTAASNAMRTVDEGIKILDYQKSKMNESIKATQNVSNQISDLYDKSQKIGQIIELISNIAKQTNLLALNAAIEAARAGELGKGFAVVADEVRELAEQSSAATSDISTLIGDIKSGVDKAVKEMNRTESIINEQNNASEQTSNAFKSILDAVDAVIVNIQEVTKTSEIVNANSMLVSEGIEELASITEENAAGTEEVAASTQEQSTAINQISISSERLAKLSRELETIINRFKI